MQEYLEIKFKDSILKGQLITEDDTYIKLKLESGYNANIKKNESEIISRKKIDLNENKTSKPIPKHNKELPNILILHTGGTIASKVDYATGAVTPEFTPEELLELYPELDEIANIKAKLVGNLLSENMRFDHYNILLEEISKAIREDNSLDGIVISHGTDTLHYTSAALEYSLEHLPIPVLLVGAQRSSDRPSSDAFSNLSHSIEFIKINKKKDKQYRRVGICMHASSSDDTFEILDGINAKKLHSSRRDAFKQINYLPVAIYSSNKWGEFREELFSNKPKKELTYTKFDTSLKIALIKSHPHMVPEELEMYSSFDALIVEGTGLGHISVESNDAHSKKNEAMLKSLVSLSKNIPIIMSTQCIFGSTNMNVYSAGRKILREGVLGNNMNLISETLFVRVAYCLSKNKSDFDKLWRENLEGFEIKTIDSFEV